MRLFKVVSCRHVCKNEEWYRSVNPSCTYVHVIQCITLFLLNYNHVLYADNMIALLLLIAKFHTMYVHTIIPTISQLQIHNMW